MAGLRDRTIDLQAGFWFTALATALVGPLLVAVVLLLDHHAGNGGVFASFFISPTSARTILGAIAGSLITIASLTSSLTIVTLQLLSSQYTPRAIRGFLRTRLSQAVFGTFVGIFVYCLLLLVTVRAPGEANDPFVPSLGVIVAIVLALGSLGLLVVFVHRLSQLIQVSTMVASLTDATLRAIEDVHPRPATGAGPAPAAEATDTRATVVLAPRAGYVQRIDERALLNACRTTSTTAHVLVCVGDFVTRRTPLIGVTGTADGIVDHLRIRTERDLDQDPSFGIRQLVDIACRALSPGINDPSTAVTCINFLREILQTLAGRDLLARRPLDTDAAATVAGRTFEAHTEPLHEIANYGSGDARVMATLRDAVEGIAEAAERAGDPERAAATRRLTDTWS